MRGEAVDPRLGRVALTPPHPIWAGARGAWEICYTVGERPLRVGGSVRIEIPVGFSPPQTAGPGQGPGYVWATTPFAAALEVRRASPFPRPDPNAWLHSGQPVYVLITGGELAPGQDLIVRHVAAMAVSPWIWAHNRPSVR